MNIIWIVADTWRRDRMRAYGNPVMHTPSLDALAAKSIRFDNHYAASFPTMPARADFLTGRSTMSFMQWGPLPQGQVTLPMILVQGGYATAAVVDTPFYLRSEMNYDRGFQGFFPIPGQVMGGYTWWGDYGGKVPSLYSEPNKHEVIGESSKRKNIEVSRLHESWDTRAAWRHESDQCAPRTFTTATEWLENHYKEDFFLYVDTWDPHEPWDSPAYYTERYWPGYDGEVIYPIYHRWQEREGFTEEKVRKANAAYCGKISMVDTWIGHLLRAVENMGLMENTAIIFTSDHGFYFGEHGGIFGKQFRAKPDGSPCNPWDEDATWGPNPLYKENVQLPLLIYAPGIQPGVYDQLTCAVDIMPTALDILGQPIPEFVEGKSLLPMMRDTSLPGREFVVSSEPFSAPGEPVRNVDNVLRRRGGLSTITVTTDEWSFLYSPSPEMAGSKTNGVLQLPHMWESQLYDLRSDPRQENNVISQRPEVAKELHQYLLKFMRDTKVAPHLLNPRAELQL